MKGEFNLPQTLLWIVSASRPLGTAEEIGFMIGGMATGRSMGAAPSLAEAFFKLQARFRLRLDGAPAPLIETQVTLATRFGEAASVGHEAAELWDDAQAEFLDAVRSGSVRAYGRRNGARDREAISPITASSARLVDHDGPSLVPKNFPGVDEPRWSDLTCEIADVVKVWRGQEISKPAKTPAPSPGKRGPKAVVYPRVLRAMRACPRLAEMKTIEMQMFFDACAETVINARKEVLAERNSEQ